MVVEIDQSAFERYIVEDPSRLDDDSVQLECSRRQRKSIFRVAL